MSIFQNALPPTTANRIICGDAQDMDAIPNRSIGLALTSPPYNAGIEYDIHNDNQPLRAYLDMLQQVLAECYRALVFGGRIAIVCANTGRSPYMPLAHRISDLLTDCGFALRGEIIWDKGAAGLTSAWGSWRQASSVKPNAARLPRVYTDSVERLGRLSECARAQVNYHQRRLLRGNAIGLAHPPGIGFAHRASCAVPDRTAAAID